MRTVWKYDVPVDGQAHWIAIPDGATIVHVACQHTYQVVNFWVEVPDTEAGTIDRRFQVFATGQEISRRPGWEHVGTALGGGGQLVWHLYEES